MGLIRAGYNLPVMDLFNHAMNEHLSAEAFPEARLQLKNGDVFVGQEEIFAPGKHLPRAIESDKLFSSILLTVPPGTGKITLEGLIARHAQTEFVSSIFT